ncbi:CPBP family intramembrane metalloprotease [Bacillus sp. BRMEA1]|uniref:CPBP family intramembrane glutamic endopeptidase n=1 Tax=Neobacillus endophyticus TaxID=2738405 RepID=UPI0015637DE0|nr:type II CAAX endopeptidase family protein [Neobacillus endophyticus]NRD77088.1 CPBP family intramembrane metalloprotease [Neobacillus endophyticus]
MLNSFIETQATPSSGLKKLLESKPLISFFVMAFAFSWITLIPYILSQWNILPNTKFFVIFFVLNPFVGPAFAAYLMNQVIGGKAAWINQRNSLKQTRVDWKWYIFILIGIPAAIFLGMIFLIGYMPRFHDISSYFLGYPIKFIVIYFFGGPLAEEIGWRGFALPRMQARYGGLKASLLIGVLWALWHLPHFLTSAQRGGPGADLSIFYINLPIFIVMCIAISIIMTWVFNHTQGSLFMAILLHTSINTFGTLQSYLSTPLLTRTDLLFLPGFVFIAFLILVWTRGSLGYSQNNLQTKTVKK